VSWIRLLNRLVIIIDERWSDSAKVRFGTEDAGLKARRYIEISRHLLNALSTQLRGGPGH
jgi:hypothetical protein